jgi:isopentenyl-diphosphate Delta-isomerase
VSDALFESRKQDHIRLALDPRLEALGGSLIDTIELTHEAIPEINFEDVSIEAQVLGQKVASPFFVSSMTAGTGQSETLNSVIARACEARGWLMGVGSQRRELTDSTINEEWVRVRKTAPSVMFMGNVGLTQVITTPVDQIRKLVDSVQAIAMIVHTNPLQESLQPEGTPQFKGGLKALEVLCKSLGVPVVLKETGCGISGETVSRLKNIGLSAVDVSGFGGTHWGRIEGQRSSPGALRFKASETFKNWGISTVDSLRDAVKLNPEFEVWASGGVRSGLDGAKLLAMGAHAIGFAKPILQAALNGDLEQSMERFEFELKVALFCTGSLTIQSLRDRKVWRVKNEPPA